MTSSEQRIEAVVFDVGGVLLDWDPAYLFRKLIENPEERHWFLTEVCSPGWNSAQDAGRSWGEAVALLSRAFPDQSELIAAYDQRWEEMIAGAIDQTVSVLAEVRAADVPTYALTNFSAERWKVATARWQFLDKFEGAVVSGVEKVTKPDPRIYQILLDRYRLKGDRTFYTDDLELNVEAARHVGLDAERFVNAAALRRQLVDRGVLPIF